MKYLQRNFIWRLYGSRTEAEQLLFLSAFFSMGLLCLRILYTGHLLFIFLAWNLFLAVVPYMISRRIADPLKGKHPLRAFFLALAWLLFIPNSFYIITDLFHLDMNRDLPLWYDLALLLSFTWSGLLLGIVSVRQMEKYVESYLNKKPGLFFIVPVMALNGLGIFVGRYLRYNSWDVLTNPFQLAQDIMYLFIHPVRSRFDWSMIVCYSFLMTLIYLTIKRLSKVF